MANQVIVTNTGNVQVALTPPPNVQVQISRAAIGTVSNVPTANFANYAGNVTGANQPNITSLGTLSNLSVSGNSTVNNLVVTGNLAIGNLVANNANYANFAGNLINGTSNVNTNGANGNISISVNSVSNVAVFANNAVTINYPINTPNNVIIGNNAGNRTVSQTGRVAIGQNAGSGIQNNDPTVAIGYNSGNTSQSQGAIAIGYTSGLIQDDAAVAIGYGAGQDQDAYSVAIGLFAGQTTQGLSAVAIGNEAGKTAQKPRGIAIGEVAGFANQGNFSIAIGANAGYTNQADYSIILNASGSNLDQTTANTFTVKPVRNANTANAMFYNNTTGEITYDLASNISVATANYANFAGQVVDNTQSNITSVGTLSNLTVSGNVSAPIIYNQGMVTQGYDFVQMQYSNGVALPVSPYDLGTGSWFYLDAGGATWQSNTTGTFKEVILANDGGISASGNITGANANLGNLVTANYFSGDGSLLSNISLNNISNGTSNVSIPVANGNVEVYANNQHWTFTDVGNLLLAGGNGVIQSIANSSLDPINPNVSTMVLTPDQGNSLQALVLDPTTPGHIHLRAPGSNIDQPQANVYLGGEISSFEVGVFNGAVPNLFIHSNNNTWMFDITGNLTLPANTFAVNYANGTQVPLDGPVANANYANFAGTAYSVDGANVSGTVANATFSLDAGNSNLSNTANSVALANVVGIGNIANINLDGSSSNVLFGNGIFAPESTSIANANYANFAGTAFSVSGSNVSGEVANANYASYANIAATANSVAVGNVSGIGNIATINLTGSSSNVLFGNGVFAPESTSIANANYANFAGTVVTSAQPNITSVGNLPYIQVSNSANSTGVITQLGSNNITIATNFSNVGTYKITTLYHPNNNVGYPGEKIVRSRGNATAPTTAVSADRIYQKNGLAYNGNTNVVSVSEVFTITGTVNANTTAQWTGGQWTMVTGCPTGDTSNQGNSSWQNQLIFTNSGSLQINPGNVPNTSLGMNSSSFLLTNYGLNTTDLAGAGGINQQKSRGSRDGLLSCQPNDTVGRVNFWGYNGTAYQSNRPASIYSYVDSSYVANATIMPLNMVITTVNSSNASVNTTFYGNGLASFPGDISATSGNITGANVVVNTSGFMKLASYTEAALRAITGQIGWMAAVSDSASFGNPNGMIAFWDTTNSRWSYVHDNSAV